MFDNEAYDDNDDLAKDVARKITPENLDILLALLSSTMQDYSLSKWGILIIYTPPAHERFEQ